MLTNDEISYSLSTLNAITSSPWLLQDNTIHKEFSFDDFKQAWSFMNKVADAAEKADHHPDWCNTYNQVSITLTTHQAGGLTAKDFDLATSIENILKTIKNQ